MRVHHLSAATLCPVSARLVNGEGPWLRPGRMVCHCWLVETNDGLVLVDTGLGRDDLADVRGRLGLGFEWVVNPLRDPETTAWAQVQKLGFRPEDVRHLIPTHLDLDHAGGLPDFPWARVHVFRPEYEAAMRRGSYHEKRRYRRAHWEHGPLWDIRDGEGEDWFGFRGVRALDGNDDILLVPLLGHTRGHCGVAVRTAAGWQLHAGDAYFFHAEMDPTPRCTPGLALFQRLVAMDDKKRRENQRRLRELVAAHGGEVSLHCAHCPVEYDRFVALQEREGEHGHGDVAAARDAVA